MHSGIHTGVHSGGLAVRAEVGGAPRYQGQERLQEGMGQASKIKGYGEDAAGPRNIYCTVNLSR
jgi:hypothetical protein